MAAPRVSAHGRAVPRPRATDRQRGLRGARGGPRARDRAWSSSRSRRAARSTSPIARARPEARRRRSSRTTLDALEGRRAPARGVLRHRPGGSDVTHIHPARHRRAQRRLDVRAARAQPDARLQRHEPDQFRVRDDARLGRLRRDRDARCRHSLCVDGARSASLFSILLSMVIGRVAFRPFIGAPPITLLITSFGVLLVIQYVAIVVFGEGPRILQLPCVLQRRNRSAQIRIPVLEMITIATRPSSSLRLLRTAQPDRVRRPDPRICGAAAGRAADGGEPGSRADDRVRDQRRDHWISGRFSGLQRPERSHRAPISNRRSRPSSRSSWAGSARRGCAHRRTRSWRARGCDERAPPGSRARLPAGDRLRRCDRDPDRAPGRSERFHGRSSL